MKIAVWQKRPISGPPPRAIEGLAQCLETLRGQRIDLLVCPELWSTGYFDPDAIRAFAEPAEGGTAAAVGRLAARAGTAVIYGYPERESGTGRIYNAARLIDADGGPGANYRKLHLWSAYERALFAPGDARMVPVNCAGWRIGLTICYDTEFPETVRGLALDGAELIAAPTALVAGASQVPDLIVPTRAIESQVLQLVRRGWRADLRRVVLYRRSEWAQDRRRHGSGSGAGCRHRQEHLIRSPAEHALSARSAGGSLQGKVRRIRRLGFVPFRSNRPWTPRPAAGRYGENRNGTPGGRHKSDRFWW
jgi:predicted amidohydrolase